ncbi:feruloyl CoA ortho-hydroxylase 1-like [Melia azedarach]|uniref:Feruloyl CoA ortho-hydroxylase 1-like n=1 Tax=Melia azedarach TaxID=155640 RepID=A0ACC1YLK8_MELAZ|nr:feruloyl CoA ortho-hydroxylase 1-like [Melia azedarach]
MEDIKNAAHGFYELPNEERRKYYKGFSPSDTVLLATSFCPRDEVALEWKDYLRFSYVSGNDQASALWPPICKDQVLEYMKRAEVIIEKLLQVLLQGLNEQDVILICQQLMSLFMDDIGGLYARGGTEDDTWVHVPPVQGALVINIGDALQIVSNDRYKSIEHRVAVNICKNTVSIPIFVNPGPDAVLGPLAELIESGEKPVYKQLLFSDYLKYFFSNPHDGKKTIDYAKI